MRLSEIFTHSGKPHNLFADELKRVYEICNSTFVSTPHFIKIMTGEDFTIKETATKPIRYRVWCEVRPLRVIPEIYWFRGKKDDGKKKRNKPVIRRI